MDDVEEIYRNRQQCKTRQKPVTVHEDCPALLALVLKPTALPSLPGVVVTVLALHSSDGLCNTHKVLTGSI